MLAHKEINSRKADRLPEEAGLRLRVICGVEIDGELCAHRAMRAGTQGIGNSNGGVYTARARECFMPARVGATLARAVPECIIHLHDGPPPVSHLKFFPL